VFCLGGMPQSESIYRGVIRCCFSFLYIHNSLKIKNKIKKAEAVNPGYSHAFLNLSIKSVISLIYIWLSRSYIIASIHLPVESLNFPAPT